MCQTVCQECVLFMCSLSTRWVTTVAGSSRVYVFQYLCEHAQTQAREYTKQWTDRIFCSGIRVKVLSLCNQLYPKTEIRLLPVTYFAVSHLQKLWESVKPTRSITVTEQYMPYSAFKSCFCFLLFSSLFVKLMPFLKKNIRLHMYNVKYIFMYIIFIWMKLSNTLDLSVWLLFQIFAEKVVELYYEMILYKYLLLSGRQKGNGWIPARGRKINLM